MNIMIKGIKARKSRITLFLVVMVMTLIGLSEKAIGATRAVDAKTAEGYYYVTYKSTFIEGPHTCLDIRIDGTEASVTGLYKLFTFHGKYDSETATLKMPSYQATPYIGEEGTPITLFFDKIEKEEGRIVSRTPLPFIELRYIPKGEKDPDGNKHEAGTWYLDPMILISFIEKQDHNDPSKLLGVYNPKIESVFHYYDMPLFEYKEEEWKDCGKALFTDGWFSACTGKDFPAYEVECRKRGTEILLVNPYGKNSPYAEIDDRTGLPINASSGTGQGYILLDIGDPDCILVHPFINSGFNYRTIFPYIFEGRKEWPFSGYFACTSEEGYSYYMNGRSIEDIKDEAEWYEDPISVMTHTGLIIIPNCRVQFPEYLYVFGGTYRPGLFLDDNGNVLPMESRIQLPEAAYSSALEDISVVEDQPVRYFNLQGIEISEPAPGIPVIVRQGNKASKVIY